MRISRYYIPCFFVRCASLLLKQNVRFRRGAMSFCFANATLFQASFVCSPVFTCYHTYSYRSTASQSKPALRVCAFVRLLLRHIPGSRGVTRVSPVGLFIGPKISTPAQQHWGEKLLCVQQQHRDGLKPRSLVSAGSAGRRSPHRDAC